MEGTSSSVMMGFGENYNSSGSGLSPITMIMPNFMTTSSSNHHPVNNPNNQEHTNTLFFPIPYSTNYNNHDPNNPNNHYTNNTGLGQLGMEINNINKDGNTCSFAVKAKIMAHPYYQRLLLAYVNCQKIGAPPQVVASLEEACASVAAMAGGSAGTACIGEDPALDQFMEAYCEMLIKYQQELSKPFKEAMLFLQKIESQFNSLAISSSDFACDGATDRNGSSENVDQHNNMIDPQAEDQELKVQLLHKYSGYLGNLKQEFLKKRKKGKLPKEARQQLLEWWSRHYKWPYPSESQKLALAEATGLDQKQINNWFINQRKRHWKPSEDMQLVVMDPNHPHHYMNSVMGNHFPMDLSHTML